MDLCDGKKCKYDINKTIDGLTVRLNNNNIAYALNGQITGSNDFSYNKQHDLLTVKNIHASKITTDILNIDDLTINNAQFINVNATTINTNHINTHDAYITGKLTVDGVVDPTGLELIPQPVNPLNNNTLWIDTLNNHLFRGSVDLEELVTMVNDGRLSMDDYGDFLRTEVIVNNATSENLPETLVKRDKDGKIYVNNICSNDGIFDDMHVIHDLIVDGLIILGTTGPTGMIGIIGIGPTGPTGPTGVIGPMGPHGLMGMVGPMGATGLKGATGLTGPTGNNGSVGPTGAVGKEGRTGANGNLGPVGPTGPRGAIGALGPTGEKGPTGQVGRIGHAGPVGQPGATGPTGVRGHYGPVGYVGPTGARGRTGATGVTGSFGPTGPDGATGLIGPTGISFNGPTGPQGATGLRGPTGLQGSMGIVGSKGDTGPAGPTGESMIGPTGKSILGPTGPDGDIGPTGPTGTPGPAGEIGPIGPTGTIGPTGESSSGPDGPTGQTGDTGPTGPIGPKGSTGYTGPTGPITMGPTGPSYTGPTGSTGPIGPTGAFLKAGKSYITCGISGSTGTEIFTVNFSAPFPDIPIVTLSSVNDFYSRTIFNTSLTSFDYSIIHPGCATTYSDFATNLDATAKNTSSLTLVASNPAIAYIKPPNLFYARSTTINGTVWSVPLNLSMIAGNNLVLFVVNNQPAIAFTSNSSIYYIRANDSLGTSWPVATLIMSPTSTTLSQGRFCLSAEVISGNPAVCYTDDNTHVVLFLRANDINGTSWPVSGTIVDNTVNGFRSGFSMIMVNGNPAIIYSELIPFPASGSIFYKRANDSTGTTWTNPRVILETNPCICASLTIINGFPAVAYSTTAPELSRVKYSRSSDINGATGWLSPLVIDTATDMVSLIAAPSGYPAIAYATTTALKYVVSSSQNGLTGTDWLQPMVVDAGSQATGSNTFFKIVNGQFGIMYVIPTTQFQSTARFAYIQPFLTTNWMATLPT